MSGDARNLVDPRDDSFASICETLREFQSYGFDVNDPEVVKKAIATARRRDMMQDRDARWRGQGTLQWYGPYSDCLTGSVVYYMRIGNRCKIGYTNNLTQRLSVFNPEELLVTEPGGQTKEFERHQQFVTLRTTGEWFRYESPLTEHVASLRGE